MPLPRNRSRLALALAAAGVVAAAGPATGQLLGGGLGGLPGGGLPRGLSDVPRALDVPDTVRRASDTAQEIARAPLDQVRRLTAASLIRDHRDVIEADDAGRPVVRGEILALGVTPAAAQRLRQAGFTLRTNPDLAELGLDSATLKSPRGLSAVEAVRRLRELDPDGQYDFNHLYQESGMAPALTAAAGAGAASAGDGRGLRVGLIDGAVAASRPALANASLTQQGFAAGAPRPTAHATAVASLLAGSAPAFRGAAPGASLYVADVYGSTPTGGSAQAVARALAWLSHDGGPVINISLVGPPNLVLEAAVKAVIARGHILVAAVGNDGPAAPPLYPAAYPGVVAVTGVDPGRRVLPEAGRGTHVDFAAQGSGLKAAAAGGGLAPVRGTSFAAPIVAGALALRLKAPDRAGAAQAIEALGREAADLGSPGADPIYGRGLVGGIRP